MSDACHTGFTLFVLVVFARSGTRDAPECPAPPAQSLPCAGGFGVRVFLLRTGIALSSAMTKDAFILWDIREQTLTIVCEPCARRARYSAARLMANHGDANASCEPWR
jgi:hypothetical protein